MGRSIVVNATDGVAVEDLDRSVKDSQVQALRWAYADGLADLSVGAVFVAIALLAAIDASLPEGSMWHGLAAGGLPIVILGAIALGRVITPWWRKRVTYARVGYVSMRRPNARRTRTLAFVVAGALSMLTGALLVRYAPTGNVILTLQGLAVAGILGLIGRQARARRFLMMAAVAIALGVVIARQAPDEVVGNAWFYGCLGVLALASGVVTFLSFRRQTTPAGN
jgi:hypothetical protein